MAPICPWAIRGSASSSAARCGTVPARRWAQIEVWPNAPYGLYAVQDPAQPEHNLRATLHADGDGNYIFATMKPVSYEVPGDGLGGELVRAGGRHCWRPAHIHILINARGTNGISARILMPPIPISTRIPSLACARRWRCRMIKRPAKKYSRASPVSSAPSTSSAWILSWREPNLRR